MPCGNAKPARFLKPNFWLFTTAREFLQEEFQKKQGVRPDCGFHSTKRSGTMKKSHVDRTDGGRFAERGCMGGNVEASSKQMKGDVREKFMKSGLSGKQAELATGSLQKAPRGAFGIFGMR
jgi:hypothetical protein